MVRSGNSYLLAASILTSCVSAAYGATGGANGESLSELLKRQTQEFSDAGHEGNKAVMDRYLDPEVVFVNEDGSLNGKKDILEGASAPPPGITMSIKVTEWAMRRHGNVAVATFVDDLTENFHGQALDFKYRSTEVWKLKDRNWRMISSQTLTLPEDPPAVRLAPAVLQDYVGTYEIAPKMIVKITRRDDQIFGTLNDGAAAEFKAEVRDVLFTPGRPGRKIFQRDEQGHITGYRIRTDGRDILVVKVS